MGFNRIMTSEHCDNTAMTSEHCDNTKGTAMTPEHSDTKGTVINTEPDLIRYTSEQNP